MESDFEAVEAAEVRLQSRSLERRRRLERRAKRRRWLPWLLCPLPLPAVGAAALVATLRSAGGDLRDWPETSAALVVAGCLLVPALIAGWIGRRHGQLDAVLWALVAFAVEIALVFGVAFALLDLGP